MGDQQLSADKVDVRLDAAEAVVEGCLLCTSDAADDLTRVDLGGRRIIKKEKRKDTTKGI
ncbi:hypothetical protein HET67_02895, partial [Streptomyces sp. McG7]|nr:hypothetical protein [Streptomyces sp. McG7]